MSAYLSSDELAGLIGCKPNSRSCMKRWLKKNGWPFVENIIGLPMVSRAYHDARLGIAPANNHPPDPRYATEPNFNAFDTLSPRQTARKEKREQRRKSD